MRKTKKNNYRDRRRAVLASNYRTRWWEWAYREPPMWRIFAWIRWRSEEPEKPKWLKEMENTCVCCGAVIPEGRQVCPRCERRA